MLFLTVAYQNHKYSFDRIQSSITSLIHWFFWFLGNAFLHMLVPFRPPWWFSGHTAFPYTTNILSPPQTAKHASALQSFCTKCLHFIQMIFYSLPRKKVYNCVKVIHTWIWRKTFFLDVLTLPFALLFEQGNAIKVALSAGMNYLKGQL